MNWTREDDPDGRLAAIHTVSIGEYSAGIWEYKNSNQFSIRINTQTPGVLDDISNYFKGTLPDAKKEAEKIFKQQLLESAKIYSELAAACKAAAKQVK